jgi:general secretion pathway protein D
MSIYMNFREIYLKFLFGVILLPLALRAASTTPDKPTLLDYFNPQITTSPVSNPPISSNAVSSAVPLTTTSITTGVQPQPQVQQSLDTSSTAAQAATPIPVGTPTSQSPIQAPSGYTTSANQTPTSGFLPASLSTSPATLEPQPVVQIAAPTAAQPIPQTIVTQTPTPVEQPAQPLSPPSQPTQLVLPTPSVAPVIQTTPQPVVTLPTPVITQPQPAPMPAITPSRAEASSTEPHEALEFVPEEEFIKEAAEPDLLSKAAYLGSYLEPWRRIPNEKIEFFFENAELSALISFIEHKFGITFLLDDNIKPLPKGGKSILGSKISFKTHTPLDPKTAWDIFVSFLDILKLSPVPGPQPDVYRIIGADKDSSRAPLPTLIGVDPSLVPDNDSLIRYVYFVENNAIDILERTILVMQSVNAPPVIRFPTLNALLITDRASNIKAMLAVLQELDSSDRQEALAIIKLKYADATAAKKLYDSLSRPEAAQGGASRAVGGRKSSTADYFNKATRVITEPRTNSLIIIGTRDAIKVIAEFIEHTIDVPEILPDVPRYIYNLKFLEADHLAKILGDAVAFKTESDAAKYGGVRDGDRYFKPISIVAESTTNSLIINADYEDYSKLYTLLQSIDIEQPQIAIRMFLVNIDITNNKGFGTQLRNKIPGANSLLGNQVNFQTSGLTGTGSSGFIQERTSPAPPPVTGATQLLGNLVNLANFVPLGSTVISLGSDAFGVWGLLNMLQTYTQANIVANPFLVTTNKYPAQFVSGDIRRVIDATIFGQQTQTSQRDDTATLDIRITPQISRQDGLITLDIAISFEQFVVADPTSSNGNKTARRLETTVVMANNEILALGGLLQETVQETVKKVPILGDIPFFGWLFQNRFKSVITSSILVLIVPEIIHARDRIGANVFTTEMVHNAQTATREIRAMNNQRDPINQLFFNDKHDSQDEFINNFMSPRNTYTPEAIKKLSPEERQHREKQALVPCKQRGRRGRKNKCRTKQCSPEKAVETTPASDSAIPRNNDIASDHITREVPSQKNFEVFGG